VTLRRVCAWVGLGVSAWCALGLAARATTNARTTADEPQYLMTAQSLAADLDLDVANQRTAGAYRAYHEVGLPLQEEIHADGSRVSPHDPLLPALLAAPMALGGWPLAKLALAGVAGCLAALVVFVAEARFGARRRVVVPVVLAAFSAAPLAVYATQVYPEIAAALALTAAIAIVTAPKAGRATFVAVAFAAAVCALPWLSVKYLPVAAGLVFVGWSRVRRGPLLGALAFGAATFAVAHLRWYGGLTPYATGRHFDDGQLEVVGDPDLVGRSVRLAGLLVDRDFGLAVWQPLLIVAVPAAAALVASRSQLRAVVLIPAALGWLNATFVALTMHGWWFPGRQVIVVLPCLVLAIVWWLDRIDASPSWLWAATALGASLYLWLVVQVLTTSTRLVTTFADLSHPWWRVVRRVLPDGRADRPLDTVLLAAWALGLGGAAIAAARAERRRRVDAPDASTDDAEPRSDTAPHRFPDRLSLPEPSPHPVSPRLQGMSR
jgi:hypothetical protein